MKQLISFVFFSLLLRWCTWSASTDFPDPLTLPPLTALITDYSSVLDSATLSWLQQQAQDLQTETTAQIATVLFPHRNGHELFDIGMRLFRESGIGQKTANNGMLLLLATDEKKLRIIVGYGLEGTFPDIRVRDLIESTLRPEVNAGNRSAVISLYHEKIGERLEKSASWALSPQEALDLTIRDIVLFGVWFGGTRVASSHNSSKKTKSATWRWSWLFLPFIGLFFLTFFWLPGVAGAFFWYVAGIFWALLLYWPQPWSFTPWSGSSGWSWWFSSWGWFWGFWWGSSGGGGAGD